MVALPFHPCHILTGIGTLFVLGKIINRKTFVGKDHKMNMWHLGHMMKYG